MPARTKGQIVADLALGLSRAKGDAVTIRLADLREAVGKSDVRKYLAADYDEEWLNEDFEDGFKIDPRGVRQERSRNVLVDRVKLLNALESLLARTAPQATKVPSAPSV